MPISEVSQARTEPQPPSRESTRVYRRGRGGRNRSRVSASRSGHDARISQSDASRIQSSSVDVPITAPNWTSGSSRGGTFNRGTRGRRRQFQGQRQSEQDGTIHRNVSRPQARRAFRGHLSSPLENNSEVGPGILAGSLDGGAPAFVPGRLVVPRTILTRLGHHLRFLHTLVAKLARKRVRPAHIHARFNAMPGHVLPVIWWDYLSFASAGKMKPVSSAETPTTKKAGAVRKYVKIYIRAASTSVRSLAMPGFAGNVTRPLKRSAIVVRLRN
ncbi:hypothetical protein E4U53_001616 [Claviceps sorghi]|nr:hypothetical protein E4U53_001616 [Claviceps sorghi]